MHFLIHKPDIVPSHKKLEIKNRTYIPTKNKALFNPDLEKITNSYLRASIELQRVFGLRREEPLKIKPHFADKGNELILQPSRCKGGRGRNIPNAYAQRRYKELTGWEAPINGGPTSKELPPEQKIIDYQARMILTEELGHGRISVTYSVYCGK